METLSSYKQFAKHILFEAEEFKAKSKKIASGATLFISINFVNII